jgi:DnaK suppressor protein
MSLTSEQLQQLKDALLKRRAELQTVVKTEMGEGSHEQLVGEVRDVGDDSVMDLSAGIDFAVAGIDAQELTDIDTALDRMAAGTYGNCSNCGVEIPLERLQSQPAAGRCLKCQSELEEGRLETPRL